VTPFTREDFGEEEGEEEKGCGALRERMWGLKGKDVGP